jgi:hypothetical protein
LRKYQNKLGVETVTTGDVATRFAGSADLYQDDGRKPWSSINFLVAHDGFTLKDLYGCNAKNNAQPWPLGPSDGGEDNNNSWDQGGVAADQRRAARNGFASLMLSAGTPMLTGGDEFLRSLGCNNNPYNVDSSGNWLGYDLTADQSTFRTFARRLIAFARHIRRSGRVISTAPTPTATGSSRSAGSSRMAASRTARTSPTATITRSPTGSTARSSAIRERDLRRVERLVGRRALHPAVAGCRQEVAPRHGYVQLGRRP